MNIFKINCYSCAVNVSSIFSNLRFLKSGSVCELYVFNVIICITCLHACNSVSLISTPRHHETSEIPNNFDLGISIYFI